MEEVRVLHIPGHGDLKVYSERSFASTPLPELGEDWPYEADDHASNDRDDIYIWHLAGDAQLEVTVMEGVPDWAEVGPRRDIADILREWDIPDDCASLGEWLSRWGLDGLQAETPVEEGYEGPCAVWCEPNYYEGTYGAPTAGRARDDHGDPLEFPSYAEAAAYVANYYNEPSPYDGIRACDVLAHGQYAADTLTIVAA